MPDIQFSEVIISVFILISIMGVFWYLDRTHLLGDIKKTKKNMTDKLYELSILKELGERTGYSLNIENIVDMITGSLNQFIEYNIVSYILIQPEKLTFKAHLEKSVTRDFLDDVKGRMIKSLSALSNKDLKEVAIEEVLSGALLLEDAELVVNSYFNIPLVIADKLVGILTIADSRMGLYKENEMTILYKLTAQASTAVGRLQEIVSVEQGKLNSMVESMSEGVIMTDSDYRVLVVNPVARRALKINNEVSIFDLIDKMSGKLDIRGRLEESVKLNKILEFKDILLEDNKFYKILISPVKSVYGLEKGKILGSVVVFSDITKEKDLEQLRKDFTSMMVHELRSPIDGINKIADLIIRRQSQMDKNKIVSEYAPLIRNSASEMLRLVNNLLDASKIEAGKYEAVKEDNDLKQLIKEKFEFYKPTAEAINVNFTTHIDENVPDSLRFDRGGVSEVLTNLLSNAFKFSPDGGSVKLNILLHKKGGDLKEELIKNNVSVYDDFQNFEKAEKFVCVSVSDIGKGISADKISELFNKFKQFKDSIETKKGTGLGLFISKGIIESHNGHIWISSKEGLGSTFIFTLPI